MSTHTDIIENYIKDVCLYIKCRKAHKEVKDELYDHISEIKERLISDGESEDEAELNAVAAMGDSRLVGEELNKKYKPQTSWSLLGLFAFIIIFSGVFFYLFSGNAEMLNAYLNFGNYLIWVGISLGLMILVMFSNYTKLNKYAVVILCGLIAVIIVLAICAHSYNYSVLRVFGVNFNIANFLMLAIIPISALVYRAKNKGFSAIAGFYILLMAVSVIFLYIKITPVYKF